MLRRTNARRLVAAAALVAFAQPAYSRVFTMTRMDAFVGATRSQYFDSGVSATDPVVGAGIGDSLEYIESSARARASHGTLRVGIVSDARNPGQVLYRTSFNEAIARFNDDVTISIPGVAIGTPATATASFHVHAGFGGDDQGVSAQSSFVAGGTLSFNMVAGANNARAGLEVGATLDYPQGGRKLRVQEYLGNGVFDLLYEALQTGSAGYTFRRDLELELDFLVGVPFAVEANLRAVGNALARSPGDRATMTVNALNTAAWGGLTNLVLADGTPVETFTALGSVRGTDSARAIQPVPLPASLPLLVGALAALPVPRRRTMRQSDRSRAARASE